MQITIYSKTYGEKHCFFDDLDLPIIAKHIWCVVPNRGTFYALTRIPAGNRKYKTIRMHQLLCITKHFIDHKDGNGLNNHRSNLRPATALENNRNTPVGSRNKSGYKGVYKRYSKYISCIRVDGKLIELGRFKDPRDAARVYNDAATKYFGEFAWLNPIQESAQS